MPDCPSDDFDANCPQRLLLDQLTEKWSMLVLIALDDGPLRFNAVKRQLVGVTQKALTQCLRRLERNGIVTRRVVPASPIAVEYAITPLGRSVQKPLKAMYRWTTEHLGEVELARVAFDGRVAGVEATSLAEAADDVR
jgi:DNA-binding HxlR family transcriptional regulator